MFFEKFAAFAIADEQVPFVENEEDGFFVFLNELGDAFFLTGYPLGGVEDEEAQIGAAQSAFRAHDTEDFDGGVVFRAVSHSGGVAEHVVAFGETVANINGVAGGSGGFADDGAFVAEDGIGEGGLADIRASEEHNAGGAVEFRGGGVVEGRKGVVDPVDQLFNATSVSCADSEEIGKAEPGEVGGEIFMLVEVEFVDDECDGLGRGAEDAGEFLIGRGDAVESIDDEEQEIGRGDGCFGGEAGWCGEFRIGFAADAPGVNNFKGCLTEMANRKNTIAGDPGLIMDDRDFLVGQTVEEGGFPDIRASDNSDFSHARRFYRDRGEGATPEEEGFKRRGFRRGWRIFPHRARGGGRRRRIGGGSMGSPAGSGTGQRASGPRRARGRGPA